jgi:hypothetical protein
LGGLAIGSYSGTPGESLGAKLLRSPLLTSLTATHVTAPHVLALDFGHRLGEALDDVSFLSVGGDDFDQLDVDQEPPQPERAEGGP